MQLAVCLDQMQLQFYAFEVIKDHFSGQSKSLEIPKWGAQV